MSAKKSPGTKSLSAQARTWAGNDRRIRTDVVTEPHEDDPALGGHEEGARPGGARLRGDRQVRRDLRARPKLAVRVFDLNTSAVLPRNAALRKRHRAVVAAVKRC